MRTYMRERRAARRSDIRKPSFHLGVTAAAALVDVIAVRSFGPFRFDLATATLERDGQPLAVNKRGLLLLDALLEAGGMVVSKDQLLDRAWPGTVVEESNLTVQMAALRKALRPDIDGYDWIVTVPRVGYRLVLPRSEGPAISAAAGRALVAVMPFANLGGDPAEAGLIEGLVDDIITELSRFKTFAVVRPRDQVVDARRTMRDLGVRYAIEGSVRRAGGTLRVAAHLADATTGEQLWAERFDDSTTGLFDLQDRITEAVVGLLEPQIRQAEIERVLRKRPESLDAYELFLRALPFVHGMDSDGYAEGIALLERAIRINPQFARAVAYAAWCYERRITVGLPPLTADDTKRCLQLVQAALSHGRDDPGVLAICGWLTFAIGRDASKGLGALRRAMAANPNNLVILHHAGYANLKAGDLAEASACFRRHYRLCPGSPDAFYSLTGEGAVQVMQGNYEQGIELLLQSLATFNGWVVTYWNLSVAYAHAGRMAEAREAVRKILELTPHATVAKIIAVPFRDVLQPRRTLFIEGLLKAGLPEK
jgi:TolB-like protein/DNA-binding winged helix-turn-helix (wHTH) protein